MPPHPFNRADWQSAGRVVEKLFPDATTAHFILEILADSIEVAHQSDAANWGVTLHKNALKLNVGRGAALSLATGRVCAILDNRDIGAKARQTLQAEAIYEAPGRLKTAPHAASVTLPAAKLAALWPLLEKAHRRFVGDAARGFDSRAPQSPTWRDAHSRGVVELLRHELGRDIPPPAYAATTPVETATEPSFDVARLLSGAMQARGLSFSDSHLAAFFTALSSKNLVILSGPSGTGKTALALGFAALMPQAGDSLLAIVLESDAVQSGQLPLPVGATRYLSLPRSGETRPATIICDGAAHPCKIVGQASGAHLQLRGAARKFLSQNEGEVFALESEWDSEAPHPTFRLLRHEKIAEDAANHLFLPVRPDWRDEKPLLGYFNPLANRYEWTPFLRFLLQAEAGFRAGNGLAYFAVFDEMNLARVEWYFADLLSILEAPRDDSGVTVEPLRFDFDSKATGELPPRELFLPPNLYFVGTINAEETAQPLSPKVLDRAWVLDAPRVDFSHYPPSQGEFSVSDAQKQKLLALFTRESKFAAPDKGLVAAQLGKYPQRRPDLSELNTALENSGAGFGFRVFDEILTFCAVATYNGLFADEKAAFDAAIALKIAPRLRGSRGQVETALLALEQWSITRGLEKAASAARRLITQLERDGFLP